MVPPRRQVSQVRPFAVRVTTSVLLLQISCQGWESSQVGDYRGTSRDEELVGIGMRLAGILYSGSMSLEAPSSSTCWRHRVDPSSLIQGSRLMVDLERIDQIRHASLVSPLQRSRAEVAVLQAKLGTVFLLATLSHVSASTPCASNVLQARLTEVVQDLPRNHSDDIDTLVYRDENRLQVVLKTMLTAESSSRTSAGSHCPTARRELAHTPQDRQ